MKSADQQVVKFNFVSLGFDSRERGSVFVSPIRETTKKTRKSLAPPSSNSN
jgi:hypothetical protein